MMKNTFLFVFLFSCLATLAQSESLFESATDSYNAGAYEKAIESYKEILDSGEHSAALYYNLGNCYYKLNQIAPSIYYYEKALLLDPGDKEIKNNLAYAQQMAIDSIEPLPESGLTRIYNSIIGLFSFDQWAYFAVVLILIFVLTYLAYYFLRYSSHKRAAFLSSMVSLIIALICIVFAFVQYEHYMSEQPAIVFAEECMVQSEPNNRSTEVFLLHEGTKVKVIDGLEDYKKIELADGKVGWVQQDDIKMLKDF
ncbi:MAG: tetratricopeptide repeat protein [Flavobacteriaceae bacterium]